MQNAACRDYLVISETYRKARNFFLDGSPHIDTFALRGKACFNFPAFRYSNRVRSAIMVQTELSTGRIQLCIIITKHPIKET
jgi:hypothetical protein